VWEGRRGGKDWRLWWVFWGLAKEQRVNRELHWIWGKVVTLIPEKKGESEQVT